MWVEVPPIHITYCNSCIIFTRPWAPPIVKTNSPLNRPAVARNIRAAIAGLAADLFAVSPTKAKVELPVRQDGQGARPGSRPNCRALSPLRPSCRANRRLQHYIAFGAKL
jgi:hypothetical protein